MDANNFFLENVLPIIVAILIAVIVIMIWLIPTFCSRRNENAKPILWLNIFLGWIPFIWIVLLLAALLGKKKS